MRYLSFILWPPPRGRWHFLSTITRLRSDFHLPPLATANLCLVLRMRGRGRVTCSSPCRWLLLHPSEGSEMWVSFVPVTSDQHLVLMQGPEHRWAFLGTPVPPLNSERGPFSGLLPCLRILLISTWWSNMERAHERVQILLVPESSKNPKLSW